MNLSELRSLVRTLANVESSTRLPSDQLDMFINDAIDDITSVERLRFSEEHITTAFVADTQTINPAPSSGRVHIPLGMYYADDRGSRVDVDQVSWNEYVDRYGTAATEPEGGSGDPSIFAIFGEDTNGNPTFYLGPIPDEDKTVFLDARITWVLEEDDDTCPLTERAPLAVAYAALIHAAVLLESEERIPTWQGLYEQNIQRHRIAHEGARRGAKVARQMMEAG